MIPYATPTTLKMRRTCIFSGLSHPALTDGICERLGKRPDKVELRKFANGETSVEISESFYSTKVISQANSSSETSVRDQDVFIVQSGSNKYGVR